MSYAVIKTWIPGETLTASDQNTEFVGKITNENDLDTRLIAEIATRATLTQAVEAISRGTLGTATELDLATLYAADAEASDTYVITLSPVPAAYYIGMPINFKPNTTNMGACTINVNELGAKSIKKRYDQDPATGDLKANQIVKLVYDGTNFQIQSPIGVGGTPRSYLAGLQLSNDTDTAHDILIAVGEATDSTGAVKLKLISAIAKQIDATWAAGDDAGGMNDGDAVGNSEGFHVFLLGNGDGSATDVGFDTSITAAGLLADTAVIAAGLTLYRRIGSVLTDGSANIRAFSQEGDSFLWTDPLLDIDAADQSTTAVTRTLSVPPNVKVHAIINTYIVHASASWVYLSSLDATDEAPSLTAGPLTTGLCDLIDAHKVIIRTNTSGQIRSRASAATTTLKISTLGWIDRRGKDD